MIGDPSGKSHERNLLDPESLKKNIDGIRSQLNKFLDFDSNEKKGARLVNNYDWMKHYTLIDFSREVGKHLTANAPSGPFERL